eukprot:10724265-Prorocentrum_lima.AAC.1
MARRGRKTSKKRARNRHVQERMATTGASTGIVDVAEVQHRREASLEGMQVEDDMDEEQAVRREQRQVAERDAA